MKPPRQDLVASWWRTFAVQGSWNYRTMIGGGMAFAILPLLRCRFGISVTNRIAYQSETIK